MVICPPSTSTLAPAGRPAFLFTAHYELQIVKCRAPAALSKEAATKGICCSSTRGAASRSLPDPWPFIWWRWETWHNCRASWTRN